MFTPAQLTRLYPSAPLPDRDALVEGREALAAAGLLEPGHRLHVFLAQLGHEAAGLTRRVEGLSYSRSETLMAVWPSRFPTRAAALPFVRNPQALAEKVYGGRADLGNTQAGDGPRYIGRGYLQITGRANYREMGARIGVDLEARPQLAAQPAIAVRAACAYWSARGLNALCDAGRFHAATRRINGGAIGYADRVAWLERARACVPWPERPGGPPLDLSVPRRRGAR